MSGNGTTLTRAPGRLTGRIEPRTFVAPDGTHVYALGPDEVGWTGRFNDGDSTLVGQSYVIAGSNVVRARVRATTRSAGRPTAGNWRLGATNTVFNYVFRHTLPWERDFVFDDIVIPTGGLNPVDGLFVVGLEIVGIAGGDEVAIPVVYVDSVQETLESAPVVCNRFPSNGMVQWPASGAIEFDVIVPEMSGDVGHDDVVISVNGQIIAWTGTVEPGWQVFTSNPMVGVTHFRIVPDVPFESLSTVSVTICGEDHLQRAFESDWSFQVEDLTAPVIASALGTAPEKIRVAFDEPVDTTAGGAASALLVSNWQLDRLDAPSVTATVVAVTALSDREFELATDVVMTRGARYLLTVSNVEDLFGNVIASSANAVEVVGYAPPVPARRRFDLWWMLPKLNRDEDDSRDLFKFTAILQELTDTLVADVDRWTEILDVDQAAERYVDQMLISLGNPFEFDLSATDKRRLVRILVAMYQEKGTAVGIINAIRFFVGLEVSIEAWNFVGWLLGIDELGVGTILAPSASFERYSFDVVSPVELVDEQRRRIRAIVDYLKPPHTHLIDLREPAAIENYDPLELEISLLGEDWTLH